MSKSEPRLYLMLPPAFAPDALARQLAEALATGEVAAVLLWLSGGDDAPWRQAAEAVLPVAHTQGIPLLIGGDVDRAVGLGADGAHLETGGSEVRAARKAHAPPFMIGAGGLASRHEAMLAAEAGVDYVFFGVADPARERSVPSTTIHELAEWWGELFQVPCVALAGNGEEAEALAATGADFIAVGEWIWAEPGGPAAAIAMLAPALHGMAVAP